MSSSNTGIEWTQRTWNPVIGCRKIAAGCKSCYAETMSKRLAAMGQADYASILDSQGRFSGRAITRPDTLAEPLRWRKPRMVFVNSMSDLFHEDVPFEFIAAVFGVMAACPQHTFQVLTKRPARALEFFEWLTRPIRVRIEPDTPTQRCIQEMFHACSGMPSGFGTPRHALVSAAIEPAIDAVLPLWPLKNVWLGVSVATQADADKNIPVLLKCPAAVRFVSAEPLIDAVTLERPNWVGAKLTDQLVSADGVRGTTWLDDGIGWVIVGGESGHGARPCDVAWIRSIVEQCKAAGVPVFVKQVGSNPHEQFGGHGALRPMLRFGNRKGGDPAEWPEDLRIRQFPQTSNKAAL